MGTKSTNILFASWTRLKASCCSRMEQGSDDLKAFLSEEGRTRRFRKQVIGLTGAVLRLQI